MGTPRVGTGPPDPPRHPNGLAGRAFVPPVGTDLRASEIVAFGIRKTKSLPGRRRARAFAGAFLTCPAHFCPGYVMVVRRVPAPPRGGPQARSDIFVSRDFDALHEDENAVFADSSFLRKVRQLRNLPSWKICALNSQNWQSYAHFRKSMKSGKSRFFVTRIPDARMNSSQKESQQTLKGTNFGFHEI